jgi:hypothetical protein
MLPSKVPCSYCARRFYPERLKVHLRFFCGPNATKSDALAKQQKKRPRGAPLPPPPPPLLSRGCSGGWLLQRLARLAWATCTAGLRPAGEAQRRMPGGSSLRGMPVCEVVRRLVP